MHQKQPIYPKIYLRESPCAIIPRFSIHFHLRRIFIILVALLSITASSSAAFRPESIKVVMDNNYPPYVFQNSDGKLQGILIDQWRLWEQKTGIKVEISAMDWGKAISRMQAGHFDVIDTIFKTDKRSTWLDFTQAYARIEVPIFFSRDISGITDMASLKGFVVAAKTGDAAVDLLKRYGIENLLLFNSYEAIIRAAKEHKVNVFVVDKPPALYFLYKFGIHDQFKHSAPLYVGEFHRAVSKGRGDLLHVVEEGFGRITADELNNIEKTWAGSALTDPFPLWQFFIAVGSLGLLTLVMFAWNRSLRNAINTRTAELKASVDALRESNEVFSLFMRHSPFYAYIKTVTCNESRVLQASDNFEQMIGISGRDMLGKTMAELFPAELAAKITADDWAVVTTGKVLKIDEELNGRSYTTIKFPIVQGDKTLLAGYTIDITERKRAEEELSSVTQRLKLAAQSAKLGIWDWDIANNTMVWDDRMLELYGLTSETFPGSIEAWQNGLHPEDRDKTITELQAALRGGKEWNTDFRIVHPDGTVKQIKGNGIVIRDSDGTPIRMLGINFDITEHRQLEAQLRQSQKMESVGTLAGGVAHDFNNILSAIVGYGHLSLVKMPEDDPNRLNIQHLLEAAEKAAHLTKDLLLFSRKQSIDRKPVDLNEIIRKLQKFLIRVIGEDIIFNTRLSEEKLMLSADSHQLEQVLMNLTTNARDAMPKGGTFTITTEEVHLDKEFTSTRGLSMPGRYALISISDTGHGMDKETRQRIFEPFFTTKEVGKGTGLGLAVVYGIIKQHEGHINVYSEQGMGSTFRIYLPLMDSEETDDKAVIAEEGPVVGGTETILMAEDDESLRRLNQSVLKQYGYTVIEAVDGEDAVNKYRENKDRIQLLLFDLIMPKMNGSEAYVEIRKITPDIKVIFASGYSPDIVRQKVLLNEDVQLIYKPVSPFELLRKVREVLDKGKAYVIRQGWSS